MIIATAVASIGAFLVALWLFDAVGAAARGFLTLQDAVASLGDGGLDDAARERAARQASLELFAASGSTLMRSVLAVTVSFLPILLADAQGIASYRQVFDFLSRADTIFVTALVLVVGYVIYRRLWPSWSGRGQERSRG